MNEYLKWIVASEYSPTFVKGEIPDYKIDPAVDSIAPGLDKTTIIGLYDATLFGSCKYGYIFTEDKLIYRLSFEKPQKIWYDDIQSLIIFETHKKDNEKGLRINLVDGSTLAITDYGVNKTPLRKFLNIMKDFDKTEKRSKQKVNYKESFESGGKAGGLGAGAYQQVNKSYNEERFHASSGHGFAAERANNLHDKLSGHDAKIVGDNNAKNGADRIVDGVYIQSKYWRTAEQSVNDCFADHGRGAFRYFTPDGKPMNIEVPSDQYDKAVRAMEEKIRQGKVPGVTNHQDAKNIIRKGHFTYKQALNLAKAGTIESLTYDAFNGAIIAGTALGVTAVISFATSVWNGEDIDVALEIAFWSGLKIGGTAFLTTVLASQLSKAGLNSALVGSTEAIVAKMGPKASAILINAFRYGSKPIYGAAAMKSAAKLLRGNLVAAGISFAVLSTFDIANIFRGRISGDQLFKNLANTGSSIAGGTGGWIGGAAIGSAIFPGPGTIVGGLIGSFIGGSAAGAATNAVVGEFIKDDSTEMVKIIESVFANIANEFLLNQKEAEKAVDRLREELDSSKLKDMFASKNREKFAYNLLTPIVNKETAKRKIVHIPAPEEMTNILRLILEGIYDNEGNDLNLEMS